MNSNFYFVSQRKITGHSVQLKTTNILPRSPALFLGSHTVSAIVTMTVWTLPSQSPEALCFLVPHLPPPGLSVGQCSFLRGLLIGPLALSRRGLASPYSFWKCISKGNKSPFMGVGDTDCAGTRIGEIREHSHVNKFYSLIFKLRFWGVFPLNDSPPKCDFGLIEQIYNSE